jgi:hypothetical protein
MTTVRLTVERLKADVSIPYELKRVLDSLGYLEKNRNSDDGDITKLAEWTKNILAKALVLNVSSKTAASCIAVWALDRHFWIPHIQTVLNDNGLRESIYDYAKSSEIGLYNPVHYILRFKKLVRELSGLEEIDVLSTDSADLGQKAQPNLTQMVARMSESELKENSRQIRNLQALLTHFQSTINEKVKTVRQLQT